MKRSAFTLIELAIVIVIIGLIVGGVLGAQSLVRSAQINSQIKQISQMEVAISAFHLEYDGLPGDFDQATDYNLHQNENGDENTCHCTVNGVRVYNGDGDGILEDLDNTTITTLTAEIKNFYIHLRNAQLIPENVERELDNPHCTMTSMNEGISYPESEIEGGFVTVSSGKNLYHIIGGAGISRHFYMNYPSVGYDDDTRPWADTIMARNHLTVQQAKKIDSKIDNGNPLNGNTVIIQEYENIATGDAVTSGRIVIDTYDHDENCVYNSVYNSSISNTKACTLAVKSGFKP